MLTRIAAVLFLAALSVSGQETVPQEAVDYARDVKPLLRRHCTACHGALKQKAKLRLDTAAFARQGGKSGPAVSPGDASASLLVRRVTDPDEASRMPAEGKPLSEKEIALLRAWIERGAPGPENEKPEVDPRAHWAFRPPTRPAPPPARDASRVHNPIDAFVAAEREKRGLTPAAPAPEETLLRRVYLDLIGLPPSREEVRAFLADASTDAYERVVDRLLESPQHGERWGRHWMDVWRYSDWYGRRGENDVRNSYPQIWRWRDWIVRSINRDKGYDRMILEMLAADEIAPEDDDAIVATGFIVRNWYSLNYHQWKRDLVEHTGKAFLGLTMNCAHCHDHKYDPISQEEYFRFRAFFEPLELRQDRVPGEPDPGPFKKYVYAGSTAPIKSGMIRVFDEKPELPTHLYSGGDERNRVEGLPPVTPAAPAFLGGDEIEIAPVELPLEAYYPGIRSWIQREEIARREETLSRAEAQLEEARRNGAEGGPPEASHAAARAELAAVRARVAADNARYGRGEGDAEELAKRAAKEERAAAVLSAKERILRAEAARAAAQAKVEAAGEKEKAAAQTAFKKAEAELTAANQAMGTAEKAVSLGDGKYTGLTPVYPVRSTGRRAALARWIASRGNPLTARIAVNHVWLRHFGRPLVESVFDFGRNGKPPSHPELLDWLAVEFMESGWSLKKLHRLIVTSATYRMHSTASDVRAAAVDPDNRYLWRFAPRRMEAESVRDSLLCVAGELDVAMGGPEIANTQELGSRRRSLYFSSYAEGGGTMKFLELFDAPDPAEGYRRGESVMPQQALALTNGPLALEMSRALARKISDADFTGSAFEQILSRGPTGAERAACEEFLRRQTEVHGGEVSRARESLVRVLFNHNDFLTIR